MADLKGKVSLDNIIVQAMKIPGVKVNRAEFLRAQFASQGILVTQIVEEGPVACDYSEIELDEMASALILRRTSESSAMSFAVGLPGGLALAGEGRGLVDEAVGGHLVREDVRRGVDRRTLGEGLHRLVLPLVR